jgi:hypothetical protein
VPHVAFAGLSRCKAAASHQDRRIEHGALITEAAEEFQIPARRPVTVGISARRRFGQFCRGEMDIQTHRARLENGLPRGTGQYELPIAYALTVVVIRRTTGCVSRSELKKMWEILRQGVLHAEPQPAAERALLCSGRALIPAPLITPRPSPASPNRAVAIHR